LVVDDHPAIREALAATIQAEGGLQVVPAARNRAEAVRHLEDYRPDVLVLDLALPDGNGFTLIDDLQSQETGPRILVYSMYDDSAHAARALQAGALGYVTKSNPTSEVITAIRKVQGGGVYLSESVASKLLRKVLRNQDYGNDPREQLTDREFTVFTRLGEGQSVPEIAEALDLSVKTIETYRRRAKEKLGCDTVDDLLRSSIQWRAARPG
jgi:DNA-binding NarL/FixJ family response regulator